MGISLQKEKLLFEYSAKLFDLVVSALVPPNNAPNRSAQHVNDDRHHVDSGATGT